MMNERNANIERQDGFSLIEMIIAMAITITITAVASSLLAQSMNIRVRANEKVDALADAQRALNIMSREIADAGFNLDDNGIVAEDSVIDENLNSTIRIRSNLNRFNKDRIRGIQEAPSTPTRKTESVSRERIQGKT